MSSLALLFAGSPCFAAAHLRQLLKVKDQFNWELVGILSQPDRPAGRGQKIRQCEVVEMYYRNNLTMPLLQPDSLKDKALIKQLQDRQPDLLITAAYGVLIPPEILSIPRYGCINVHASLLPKWRGAAPIQRAIANGDRKTGVTIMQMDRGLDTGDILLQKSCAISGDETAETLEYKLVELGTEALIEVLLQFAEGQISARKQDQRDASYAPAITKAETWIDWHRESALQLSRKIRAFWPQWRTRIRLPAGKGRTDFIQVHAAHALVEQTHKAAPGTVVEWDADKLKISCIDGTLELLTVLLPGKARAMEIGELFRGHPGLFAVGQQLP